MPRTAFLTRTRRRRARQQMSSSRLPRWAAILGAVAIVLVGGLAGAAGLVLESLGQGLPTMEDAARILGSAGVEAFLPTRLYDRTAEVTILELLNPLAAEREWISLDNEVAEPLGAEIVAALLAAHDPALWAGKADDEGEVYGRILWKLLGAQVPEGMRAVCERLVDDALLPLQEATAPRWSHALRRALLAVELSRQYAESQILEWYLNTVYFGNQAYGLDAAALVYLGKHAEQLTLAEAAFLAPIAVRPQDNPVDAPVSATENALRLLQSMAAQGLISEAAAQQAAAGELQMRPPQEVRAALNGGPFASLALSQLEHLLGPEFLRRGGLKVITTLDVDLQRQAMCAAEAHLRRMSGETTLAIQGEGPVAQCEAAAYLTALRPSEALIDHRLTDYAVLVMDPQSGEILALAESPQQGEGDSTALTPRGAGAMFDPFVYLTAFARGYSPASMVLDIPLTDAIGEGGEQYIVGAQVGAYHGPVRMRTALANAYQAATARVLNLVGVDSVLHTAHQMGLNTFAGPGLNYAAALGLGSADASLLDLVYSYGVMANQGVMVGLPIAWETPQPGYRSLEPLLILGVEDRWGHDILRPQAAQRPILSPELAYLITDVLRDDVARWPTLGKGNPLEVGRPAGARAALGSASQEAWAVGFTPSRVVGVWVGNGGGEEVLEMDAANGAAPIWHALMTYENSHLPREGWALPQGVSQVEVCDPSGELPTDYCPSVVREVFISGTEPTSSDRLYRPFLLNKETGKLATIFTPLDLVHQQVFMIPPPEAAAWAAAAGIDLPPHEYDAVHEYDWPVSGVGISYPTLFSYQRGRIIVQGSANQEGMLYYRLQYGAGLNPQEWIQIGEDLERAIAGGVLGVWDASQLSGVYTLQLLVVGQGGRLSSAVVAVTIDNQPPTLAVAFPLPGQVIGKVEGAGVVFQAQAADEIALRGVQFFVDGVKIGEDRDAPYEMEWQVTSSGEHFVEVRAFDMAGNSASSGSIQIRVVP
jgi:membrane carboxypeptidase/penicillin-binding protein